ncbi:MAG: energy-coupling factor ABC transporter ATP-binding protein [Pelotomaculaceae bacterium]|jgi:energy-coupling factor transport system ATP-binding protein|uniref:ABC-type cobalt transport system, ATPase component n=1 Tax=anaerobic digester metagenome TaxID=1263854 RepID=A0A485M6Q6_9ZZZZ|nr:ABC transporter ATP-binding protein [Bacillota bacterium]HHU86685.1 ATP-binding cassette domain-containing protein [Peptococcaceae bacterium]
MQRKARIKVEKLTYHYGSGQPVLKNISFETGKGECIALIGQNGAGKTTLAKHFNGLHRPSSGKVYIDGIDTTSMKVSELARKVGFVFQNPDHQIFHDTVAREVAFGLRNLRLSRREIEERTAAALEAVGLTEHCRTYPFNLSKGQRQRIALASVLAMQTETIVLDEPTTGQDFRESVQIMEIVRKLNENGHTIIFITHDMSLVARYARRVLVLCRGEILADGDVRSVFAAPEILKKTYLRPPQITNLARCLGRHSIPPDVLGVRELYELLVKMRSEKIGCCS